MDFVALPSYVDTRGTGVEVWYFQWGRLDIWSTQTMCPERNVCFENNKYDGIDVKPIFEHYKHPKRERVDGEHWKGIMGRRIGKASEEFLEYNEPARILAFSFQQARKPKKIVVGPYGRNSLYKDDEEGHSKFIEDLEKRLGFGIHDKRKQTDLDSLLEFYGYLSKSERTK